MHSFSRHNAPVMIIFLAVLATAPLVDTSLSWRGHFGNLLCGVCIWCCGVCSGDKRGVYSDREEAEEGGEPGAKKQKFDTLSLRGREVTETLSPLDN